MPEQLLNYKESKSLRDELVTKYGSKLNLSTNANKIYDEVYNKTLEDGSRERSIDRMAAVAVDIASADLNYLPENLDRSKKFEHVRNVAKKNLELYLDGTFRANTPANINMGRWEALYDADGNLTGEYTQPQQLGSACFVIPVADTFGKSTAELQDGILEAWVTQQLVHKGGGGTGFSFQRLRPKGSKIKYNPAVDGMNSMSWEAGRGVSSGYESFLNFYFNQSTDAVKQGNSRRGANMGIQRIDHMDFLDHMYAKFGRGDKYRSEFRMKNFNLSMAVTDEFMEAAIDGRTYTLFNSHRADSKNKRVLEKKFGVKNPEVVRKGDIATRKDFEEIVKKNGANPFNPVTTPSLYLDDDGITVINAYEGEPIGMIFDDIVRIDAKKVLDLAAKLSHTNGEPGMVFFDRMNESNYNLFDEEIEATNPCGEQPLPPYDACNLGSINVGNFVKHKIFDSKEEVGPLEQNLLNAPLTSIKENKNGKKEFIGFDWEKYKETIHHGVRFLDNVIDRSDYPAEKITESVKKYRNIGLGLMGVYDAMVLMKMRYGSKESLEFATELAKVLHDESLKASQNLAKERGAYPLFETSFHNPNSELYKWLMSNPKTIPDKFRGERKLSDKVDREKVMTYGGGPIRNSARMTQAPTGTIRRSAGHKLEELSMDNLAISSGIEPMFTLYSDDNILNDKVKDWSSAAVKLFHREGLDVPKVLEAIKKNRGSVFVYDYTPKEVAEVLKEIPEDVRNVLVTAAGGEKDKYEIKAEDHVNMLAAFQKYNDSATSKTTNLPKSASIEDMRNTWIKLWELGAKGGTVYRDQSREYQILNVEMETVKVESPHQKRRPLIQEELVIELPYLPSNDDETKNRGDIDFNPGRVFTHVAYNPVNKRITGVFQSFPEVDLERISSTNLRNIQLSSILKNKEKYSLNAVLDDIIDDIEKMPIVGGKKGVVVDEAVMNGSNERKRFEVTGATTTGALLNALYVSRYVFDGGNNFDRDSIEERLNKYYTGGISLKSIINTKGKITLKEGNGSKPSILGTNKVIVLPPEMQGVDCPECM